MKKSSATRSGTVVQATRNAVVGGAKRVDVLKRKSNEFAQKVKETWNGSQKARDDVKKTAREVVAFGMDVREGLKKGFADVRKKNKAKA